MCGVVRSVNLFKRELVIFNSDLEFIEAVQPSTMNSNCYICSDVSFSKAETIHELQLTESLQYEMQDRSTRNH